MTRKANGPHPFHLEGNPCGFSRLLHRMAARCPEPRIAPIERKPWGGVVLLTDAQVAHIRYLHEIQGIQERELYEIYRHWLKSREYLYKLLKCETRSKILPAPNPNAFEFGYAE